VLITLVFGLPILQALIHVNGNIQFPEGLQGIEEQLIQMETERNRLSERMILQNTPQALIINLLIIAVLPALGEEFFFRGILQQIFSGLVNNRHLAILLASVIFSAFHLQFYGFIPRLLLGLYFGYLFVWSGTIWLPVIAHFLNNAIAVLLVFFTERYELNLPDFLGNAQAISLFLLILSILLTGAVILITRKLLVKN